MFHKEWFTLYLRLMQSGLSPSYVIPDSYNLAWELLLKKITAQVGWSYRGSQFRTSNVKDWNFSLHKINLKRGLKPSVHGQLTHKNTKFLLNTFITHWQLARPKSMYDYTVHRDFRLLFLHTDSHDVHSALISARKYFSRWVDSYNLMFNLFYAEPSVQMLSNKLFIEESLVFNWDYSLKNYKLFKYTQPWLIFKDAPHGGYIHKLVRSLKSMNTDFLLLVDIHNHNKLLSYLQRYSFYIIGLIPVSRAPWRVSYPIPTFSDSRLSQFYFLRWTLLIKNHAKLSKYQTLQNAWKNQQ